MFWILNLAWFSSALYGLIMSYILIFLIASALFILKNAGVITALLILRWLLIYIDLQYLYTSWDLPIEPIELFADKKWNLILNRDIPDQTWKLVHKACFNTVKDNYLIHIQFKIINQILGTDNIICNFCKDNSESIIHLFFIVN